MSADQNSNSVNSTDPENYKNHLISTGNVPVVFRAIQHKGVKAKIVGDDIPPRPIRSSKTHYQGVAITDSQAVLTRNKLIILGRKATDQNDTSECRFDLVQRLCIGEVVDEEKNKLNHLGGIQTIGKCLVVGFESNASSEIRFYKFEDDTLAPIHHLTIKRKQNAGGTPGSDDAPNYSGKAGSVGITNYIDGEGFRYLLAVCPKEDEIHFYRTTKPNVLLNDCKCSFGKEPFRIWRKSRQKQKDNWYPDSEWNGYVHSISLLAAEDGALYLVGLHKSGHRDYADLYHLELGNGNPTLTKLLRFHAKCEDGTSFRNGGSAYVTEAGHIRLYACELYVNENDGERYVRMNIFHCEDDDVL